ncbi:MAG: insulinase family protein [Gemmatimonadetes bacterium]|nr:insulinase family protein [Gemmatimonadota bacterium]
MSDAAGRPYLSAGDPDSQPVLVPARELSLIGTTIGPVPIPSHGVVVIDGLPVDPSTPLVAVSMWYHVGSAHEPEGRSGFAHLFEHLLFEETENLADGDMDRLITQAGGVNNGTTDSDRTAYWELLPSNRLNLALWLHAERMDRLRVSERGLATQREVVQEERRMRYDNQPYASAQLTLDTLSQDYRPYRHTTIGTMDDLEAATASDVQAFYRTWYVPNNAVLTVVGDVTVAEVRALTEEYLGGIARGDEPPPLPAPPATPRTDGERRLVVDDPMAQLPLLWMAFTIPPAGHPDQYALSLLSTIFSGGASSRLYRRLVQEERAALDMISLMDRRVGTGTFRFGALPNHDVEVGRLEALVLEEIERLQEEGVTRAELDKAMSQRRAAEVRGRLQAQTRAEELQRLVLHHGDPFLVNQEMERYEAVTPEDVRRVARTYLTPGNRTVVVARPATAAGGAGGVEERP